MLIFFLKQTTDAPQTEFWIVFFSCEAFLDYRNIFTLLDFVNWFKNLNKEKQPFLPLEMQNV